MRRTRPCDSKVVILVFHELFKIVIYRLLLENMMSLRVMVNKKYLQGIRTSYIFWANAKPSMSIVKPEF